MKILLLESFYTSSHRQWADGLKEHSTNKIKLLTLPGRHWKWRMHHAGKYFAFEIAELESSYDLILCSDLMNVAEFRGLLRSLGKFDSWYNRVPVITYFHENQITYPWSNDDPDVALKRDNHYGWINYVSCLASDHILFNSRYHSNVFLNALPAFLGQFPSVSQADGIKKIEQKSEVMSIGLPLKNLSESVKPNNIKPVILWNHRWEYDKNPEMFFQALIELKEKHYEFEIILAGEKYNRYPKIFDLAKEKLSDRIVHFGFAKDKEQYHELLLKSDILPITSNQDYFGISAIEAIAAGCVPILPSRLAFPEHLTDDEFQKYYYNSRDEFVQKLKTLITNCPEDRAALRSHILKYDCELMTIKYDDCFERIVQNY